MKKAVAALALAALLALAGCSSGMTAGEVVFDGSEYSDTGRGTMVLETGGGTSEGGAVPEIPAMEDGVVQLGLALEGGDGSVCVLYVDGIENGKWNFGERSDCVFTVMAEQLREGEHAVELVKMDGGVPTIYKRASYRCV